MPVERIEVFSKDIEDLKAQLHQLSSQLNNLKEQRKSKETELQSLSEQNIIKLQEIANYSLNASIPLVKNAKPANGNRKVELDFIEKQKINITELNEALKKSTEQTISLKTALVKLQTYLNANEQFSQARIATFVKKSLHIKLEKNQTAMTWLLSNLDEPNDNYNSLQLSSEQRKDLLAAITRKVDRVLLPSIAENTTRLDSYESALMEIPAHRESFIANWDKKAMVTKEIEQLSISININAERIKMLENERDSLTETFDQQRLEEKIQAEEASRIAETLRAREVLVDTLHPLLDTYITAREVQYKVKDAFAPADQRAREIFIDQIGDKLNNFVKSGNNNEVIKFIIENKNKFPGTNLKVVLNKIIIRLRDAESKINPQDEAKKAQERLAAAEGIAPEYVARITELSKKITELHQYGMRLPCAPEQTIITDLATKLQADVDFFCNTANPAAYERFKTTFAARLHSVDDVMSNHESTWKAVALNVFIGVISLGVALGIKAVHSKISTGQFTLFGADTTAKGKLTEAIEEAMHQTPAHA